MVTLFVALIVVFVVAAIALIAILALEYFFGDSIMTANLHTPRDARERAIMIREWYEMDRIADDMAPAVATVRVRGVRS